MSDPYRVPWPGGVWIRELVFDGEPPDNRTDTAQAHAYPGRGATRTGGWAEVGRVAACGHSRQGGVLLTPDYPEGMACTTCMTITGSTLGSRLLA